MFAKLARSAVLGIVAAGAGAAGVGVGAFALFAALKDGPLGQAGAAAVVAVLFLLVAGAAAMIMRGGGSKDHDEPKRDVAGGAASGIGSLRDRALALAKQRPLIAGAVGVVGALYVLRNPALISALVGALAGRAEGKYEQRRRGFF